MTRALYGISVISTALLILAFIFSYQATVAENSNLQLLVDSRNKYDSPTEEVTVIRDANAGALSIASVRAGTNAAVSDVNRLVVSKMNVDSVILEGKTTKILNQGLWRIPGTSTPDRGGNTVIAAHRWKWLPFSRKSFYDIEKVVRGDAISVQWQGREYAYKVVSAEYVKPDEVSILANTKEPQLTLFSCAPLFSTKYRYVVRAQLVSA